MKFIRKIFFIMLFVPISIFAYIDSDFDGVEDIADKCPNSSIIDIVDKNGCVVEKLESLYHFDVILGAKSIKIKDKKNQKKIYLTIQTAQIDYFYKNFSVSLSTSKNNSNFEDTYTSIKYKYKYNDLLAFYTSLNVILPTYKNSLNNNRIDYGISQSIYYKNNNISIFTSYRFTLINDKNIDSLRVYYQNTNSYMLGIGYNFLTNLYSSISVSSVDSIYRNSCSSISTNIYLLYSLDKNWFINPSFTKTYNDKTISDTLSFKIGYYY